MTIWMEDANDLMAWWDGVSFLFVSELLSFLVLLAKKEREIEMGICVRWDKLCF